jgi:hypothetical protein
VNWIFRGLLSCSMAGGSSCSRAAAGEKSVGLGAGAGASPLAPLRPRPQPDAQGSRLPAPGSRLQAPGSGDSAAADWLHTRPSRPSPPLLAGNLNPLVAAPAAEGVTAPWASKPESAPI